MLHNDLKIIFMRFKSKWLCAAGKVDFALRLQKNDATGPNIAPNHPSPLRRKRREKSPICRTISLLPASSSPSPFSLFVNRGPVVAFPLPLRQHSGLRKVGKPWLSLVWYDTI